MDEELHYLHTSYELRDAADRRELKQQRKRDKIIDRRAARNPEFDRHTSEYYDQHAAELDQAERLAQGEEE
jgi:hypothetical protein